MEKKSLISNRSVAKKAIVTTKKPGGSKVAPSKLGNVKISPTMLSRVVIQ
jgi:hypothetical protein